MYVTSKKVVLNKIVILVKFIFRIHSVDADNNEINIRD